MQKNTKLENVRWGIIGVGDVCEKKSAPSMSLIENSELVAVMRRHGEKAADFAHRHGVPRWYDNAESLINDPEVNAIYIATPPHMHAYYTEGAARAGKPVYVEKPMAKSHGECLKMIETCHNHDVPLFVAYYRRALPNFLKIKALIEEGAIGAVRAVQINLYQSIEANLIADSEENWRVNPDIAGAGYFYDLASHQLDFLDFLFGPVKQVAGFALNQGGLYAAEDVVTGSFVFKSGIAGSGAWCFTTSKISEKDMTTIIGSHGQIMYSTFSDSRVWLNSEKWGNQEFSFIMPKHIQLPLIETVVKDLLGKGSCPSTGISGARTNWVMDQMLKSYTNPKIA
jgi:predicted dehydrogenase